MDLSQYQYNPMQESIVDMLTSRTLNPNREFFRLLVAYYFAKIATTMGTTVESKLQNQVPTNMYAISLAPSGFGKGNAIAFLENHIFKGFLNQFKKVLMPAIREERIQELADISYQADTSTTATIESHIEAVAKMFKDIGTYVAAFDEASSPAIKQLRHTVQLMKLGALNLEIDEIGSNLVRSNEALRAYLELYDRGQIKAKLIKHTKESTRYSDLDIASPANLLAFGTPAKLLNNDIEEDIFQELLIIGYARRCFFAFTQTKEIDIKDFSEDELNTVYNQLVASKTPQVVSTLDTYFKNLADSANIRKCIYIPTEVDKQILLYRNYCETRASQINARKEALIYEMQHRHFKATKLAAVYAFIDSSPEVSMSHWQNAVRLVEDSGDALEKMCVRDKHSTTLCKFIAQYGQPVTMSDLSDHLPFYKKATATQKKELIQEAKAWGYKKHIIIQEYYDNDIIFYKGEELVETDLKYMYVSTGVDNAYNYRSGEIPFNEETLLKLCVADRNFVCHRLVQGTEGKAHRRDASVIEGHNLIAIDVDKSDIPYDKMSKLLNKYHHFIYTTKSNGLNGKYSYRILIPSNYIVHLENADFKQYMQNIIDSLPITNTDIDTGAIERCRKWAGNVGAKTIFHSNDDCVIFDILDFIPKTSRNTEYTTKIKDLHNLDALERYFILQMQGGSSNRNNNLLRYALMLLDSCSNSYDVIRGMVLNFNNKLNTNKLSVDEIDRSIMVTVQNKINEKIQQGG